MNQWRNESIKAVAVVGAGTMGHGIAQVLVRSGYSMILNDLAQQFLDRAVERIRLARTFMWI